MSNCAALPALVRATFMQQVLDAQFRFFDEIKCFLRGCANLINSCDHIQTFCVNNLQPQER